MMKRSASPYAVPLNKQGRVVLKSRSAVTSATTRLKSPNDLWLEILQQNEVSSHSYRKSSLPPGSSFCQENTLSLRQLQSLSASSVMSQKSKSRSTVPKTPEDMYDEIIQLKKNLLSLTNENCLLKTKQQKLEDDNIKKSRQIQELLNLLKTQESSAGKHKQTSGMTTTGMRQRVLRLEQLLKEKDYAQSKLEKDIQYTNIKEMTIQIETFFQEIVRLQSLVSSLEEQSTKSAAKNELVFQIIDGNKVLTEENESLQNQIKEMSAKFSDYQDISSRCAKLEIIVEKFKRGNEKFLQDGSKIKKVIHKAKEERFKFKKELAEKEKEILVLKAEVETLHKSMEAAYKGLKFRETITQNLRKQINKYKKTEQNKCTSEKPTKKNKVMKNPNSPQKVTERQSNELSPGNCQKEEENQKKLNVTSEERLKQEEQLKRIRLSCAARVIQREWRKFREKEEATVLVQSTIKAHLARKKYLQNLGQLETIPKLEEEFKGDEAVTLIQSAVRGHISRSDLLNKFTKKSDFLGKLPSLTKCTIESDDSNDTVSLSK